MKTATADIDISYYVDCPHCQETMYSEYCDDWDIGENVHYDIKIKCSECEKEFIVCLP